jgi:SAM-dependent methyltransferase
MSSQLPSSWVTQHCPTPHPARNRALDLACGKGRHSFWLAGQGWQVTAIDRDLSQTDTGTNPAINWIEADLETGTWQLGNQQFDLVVVVNYLHRPRFDYLRKAVRPGGTLIYETFMVGNEVLGRPRSPDFLLKDDELADVFSDWLISAQKQGPVHAPETGECIAIKQAIVSKKPA